MPTHNETDEFLRGYDRLSDAEKQEFRVAVRKLVADLRTGEIRDGLRVKRYRRRSGWWEMSWAPNGRALFQYGSAARPGHPHVIWLRIGGHEIFKD